MSNFRASANDPANVPSEQIGRLTPLFVFLQVFGGQVGLPLFIGTMLLSKKVKQHLMLVNFLGSWIIYSVVYCLTIFNKKQNDSPSGRRLCIAQAVLVHGVVPLAVTTYCALHVQVWLGLRAALSDNSWSQRHRRQLLVFMLFAPYVVFLGFCIASLVVILKHPDLLQNDSSYYCTINFNPLVFAVPGYAATVIVIMLALEAVIGVMLVRRWNVLRRYEAVNENSLSMIIRISVFSVYGFATLAACAAFLARSLTAWPYLVQASLPTAIFLAFGTRRDVWDALSFWRRGSCTSCIGVDSDASQSSVSAMHPAVEVQQAVDKENGGVALKPDLNSEL